MAETRNPRKLIEDNQIQILQKYEKQHSWVVVRNLFTCKYVQVQQQQPLKDQQNKQFQQSERHKEKGQEQKKKKLQEQRPPPTAAGLEECHQKCKKLKQPKEEQPIPTGPEESRRKVKPKQEPPPPEPESTQKCKKMKEPMQEPQPQEPERNQKCKKMKQPMQEQPASGEESSLKCKKIKQGKKELTLEELNKRSKKMKCSGSLCSNTKVMQRPHELSSSPETQKKRSLMASSSEIDSSNRSTRTTLSEPSGAAFSTSSSSLSPSISGSFRAMPFRKLSGCYECRMVVDPVLGMTRDPSLRATISSCPECGEIFTKPENLELHQAVRHAVSELGPEDTSKNIVEIIFQSSWLKKQTPVCKIDRILKVQNTPKTISRFEEYRDSIKVKATRLPKKHPRCIADGNELLRFHCTSFVCSLGLNGSSNLCNSIPNCNVCSIIKNGFKANGETVTGFFQKGILTTATSGRAHDRARLGLDNGKRAMLVCRVISGRVKKNLEGSMDEYDSLAGVAGTYPNLDELYVFNPKAILPCFVVIYTGF